MIPLSNGNSNLSGSTPFDGNQWGVILAGGAGVRLRPLIRRITGDDRPKQFCPILGPETLLDQTRRRVSLTISPGRTLVVVTQPHEAFYSPLLHQAWPNLLLVQPENRGTSPAILYSLLRIAGMAPMDSVAFFPSDHYVSDDRAFMHHIELAFEAVRARPELIVLLGIAPETPEVQYGWIEPGAPLAIGDACPLYQVRRFWEKPPLPLAETLLKRNCFWNSFVMVGSVSAFLMLIKRTLPDLYCSFASLRFTFETPQEREAVRRLYSDLPSINFSQQVLVPRAKNLAVLPVRGVAWSDLGEPNRVLSSLARGRIRTGWAGASGLSVA